MQGSSGKQSMSKKTSGRIALMGAALASLSSFTVAAQTSTSNFEWEEFSDRLAKTERISPLGPDLFGDKVRLANGELGFELTDIALPGNNSLEVKLTRSYQVMSRKTYVPDAMLADWQINVPNISGSFAPDWGVGSDVANATRCTNGWPPDVPFRFETREFWTGLRVEIPDGGGELLRTAARTSQPQDGASYPWTTTGQIFFTCLPSIKNAGGEGFLAITPDGTRYWFDWLAQRIEPTLKKYELVEDDGTAPTPQPWHFLQRRRNMLLATKVQDRFGNTVQYTYANAWNASPRLTAITASDGRQLTLTYSGDNVSAVSDGARQWQYRYNDSASRRSLAAVALPDGSQWTIDFNDFTRAVLKYAEVVSPEPGELFRTCFQNEIPLPYPSALITGTMVHPSGAVGRFAVAALEHGRSHVPLNCQNVEYNAGFGNNQNDDINTYAISGYSLTLTAKSISGPGLPNLQWQYAYTPNISYDTYPGQDPLNPVCQYGSSTACEAPLCTSEDCAQSNTTTVTGPGGEWIRYSHGNSYRYNEGKLLKVEVGTGPNDIQRTTSYRYDLGFAGQNYPARYGVSTQFFGEGWASEYHRPQLEMHTSQQGIVFSSVSSELDYFARPHRVARYSTLGFARTDGHTYYDDTARWVVGQRQSTTCLAPASCAGQVMASVVFDPETAQPVHFSAFGALQQTLTYHPTGSIATVSDARDGAGVDTTMTLLDWKRGIPQSVYYGDGAMELATVNDQGWITQYADANGFPRSFAYDAMGRLARKDLPQGDTVAWNPTLSAFEAVPYEEYGLPAGHWRGSSRTGNWRKQVYYDALWRPVVTVEEDLANPQATQRWVATRYDDMGRVSFTSYPRNLHQEGSANYTDAGLQGIYTVSDLFGRPLTVQQDSELGLLTTRNEYLTGFQTRTTSPKGQKTTIRYMAFDKPDTGLPVFIDEPGGVITTIERDAYGKPLEISRSGGVQ
ncbi:wall associated protein [Stenotrophomonas oahuensis]|uniref:Wall associated protein n=1 Tax=Stenotrophomonas oahuensis TaxID=3003271 RepID=A0ABY9YP85_9GAMM|nr:wall associated protein [Stenotrophomonas sp. A5586]WNH52265.1 wall associated protein [Stenotrophomonas sp. A5586]